MKQVRTLGFALMLTLAMAAFSASTAGATIVESTGVKVGVGTKIVASLETKSSASLSTTGGTEIKTCTSGEITGEITNAGGSGTTVSGTGSTFSIGGCSGVTVSEAFGELEVHHIPGTDDGTLTATGATVTVHTAIFGLERCTYGAGAGLDLGIITGASSGNATADIDTAVVLLVGHSNTFLCPGDARLIGKGEVTTPHALQITAN